MVWFVCFQSKGWLFGVSLKEFCWIIVLLFHCTCRIWPQKAVELQVEFLTVWYIFDEQVECIWKSLDTNVEKVVESAKDTKKVKDKITKEIEQNLLQGVFTLTLRIWILRSSLFWARKYFQIIKFINEILYNFLKVEEIPLSSPNGPNRRIPNCGL